MSISSSPVDLAAAVTASDTDDQTLGPGSVYPRAFLVTVAGNVKVTTTGETTATIPVAKETIYPISCRLIWSTGTTATGIIMFA